MGGQERANMNYFFVLLCAAGFRVTFFARPLMIEKASVAKLLCSNSRESTTHVARDRNTAIDKQM
jgi:hypothetical protein